ncbi:MAG: 4-oxalocrotonate tautomerase DmpI [bacterium]|nr:4-oxalocrotonate tautomerase DmpI [bacterium]
MPTIFFYGPRLDMAKKRELVRSFTRTASELTGIPESAFVVHLKPCDPEDVGVGGELLIDRRQRSPE